MEWDNFFAVVEKETLDKQVEKEKLHQIEIAKQRDELQKIITKTLNEGKRSFIYKGRLQTKNYEALSKKGYKLEQQTEECQMTNNTVFSGWNITINL